MSNELWRKTIIGSESNLRQAIVCLNESGLKIVLVVDQDGCLKGTLSDGDIRRGLLGGLGLDSLIRSVLQIEPLVVPPGWGRDVVIQLMRANKIHQLPIVDGNQKVVGLHLWDDINLTHLRTNTMVIMAGGRGSRLGLETENCPKPLLKVGNKPMLEHIIEHAKSEGFCKFVLSTHYLGHLIEAHFGDGSRWDVNIDYIKEDTPLGTAGALSLIDRSPEVPLIVTNGDVLTDVRYGEMLDFHIRHRATATMAVRMHEWQHPFGVVNIDGVDIVGFEEKPVNVSHINAGIYVLDPNVLKALKYNIYCDMPDLFSRIAMQSERTIVYPMHEPWLDVGRPADLALARSNHGATEQS